MKTINYLLVSIGLATGLVATHSMLVTAQAEEIRVPIAQQGSSDVKVPKKGMTKAQVQKYFGEAESASEAIGEPPISRWTYKNFSVYFEYDHVIHAVIHPKKSS